MIVCDNCGAEGDDAYDTRQTVGMRHGRLFTHKCRRCGSLMLKLIDLEPVVIVLDEWDDEALDAVAGGMGFEYDRATPPNCLHPDRFTERLWRRRVRL